ncbi:MAG: hypothetical protein ED555_12015 [Allomuricauda sp.]|nr:MAG: hypothetical protein ED555_12015 [Allomuricauda sp.]
MKAHLYFICPTDHLEPVINESSDNGSHYYTSLGNSVVFTKYTINQIEHLIAKYNIEEATFILSSTNPIIRDALERQDFSGIRGLNGFYDEIARQKRYSKVLWQEHNNQFIILSYYLNKKIEELQHKLKAQFANQIKITGKIYDKKKNTFDEIYPNLVCTKFFSLN